jgi:glycosyltransferase involved in cell wall biosynthesis
VTDLVSVIVPAYNAQATVDETLRSVRTQTHANLEIIVVDDGSRDRTAEIVAAHAAADKRVRIIRQPNAGVADARNRGAREAGAQLLAFVDADDLWSPDKIEKQLVALRAGGPRIGLVYTWYAFIDKESRVGAAYRPRDIGDVVEPLCRANFVGNGSSALVTRAAFNDAGGFDPTLRARGASGCEDWRFYFDVAERYHFALVPELLTGYRQDPSNMSGDPIRMLRSLGLVAKRMQFRQPQLRDAIARGNTDYAALLLERAIAHRRLFDAARLALALLRRSPGRAARLLAAQLAGKARNQFRDPRSKPRNAVQASPFIIGDLGT